MVDVEKISTVAFKIIAYSGTARSHYIQAGTFAAQSDFEAAKELIKSGDDSFIIAHEAHKELVVQEARTFEPQITLLLAHAEDQLMSAETLKVMVEQMMQFYRNILNAINER